MTADAHGASVQVLTAEVRTLVVGSRQVTMSIYDQLDDVPPSEVEPFGRVSPKVKYGRFCVYTVGRHVVTDALVRSYVPRWPSEMTMQGLIPIGRAESHRYRHWVRTATFDEDRGVWQHDQALAEQQIQELAQVAECWVALSLIVLAGLR